MCVTPRGGWSGSDGATPHAVPGETAERAGGRGAENGRSFNQALYPVYALSPALMPRATSADASRRARAWKSRYVMRRSSWITATRSEIGRASCRERVEISVGAVVVRQ